MQRKGEVFQRDVSYTDVQQKAVSVGTPGRAVVNSTDALLHFYASQRDEAAELDAQSARFRAMNQDTTSQALAPMITDHRTWPTGRRTCSAIASPPTSASRRDPPSRSSQTTPTRCWTTTSRLHERTISDLRERMGDVRGGPARDLMQDGLAGAQQHLGMLRGMRGGDRAAPALPAASSSPIPKRAWSRASSRRACPTCGRRAKPAFSRASFNRASFGRGPGVRQKGETGVEQKEGPGIQQKGETGVQQKGDTGVQQKGDRKAESKEEKEKGKPAPPETFAPGTAHGAGRDGDNPAAAASPGSRASASGPGGRSASASASAASGPGGRKARPPARRPRALGKGIVE